MTQTTVAFKPKNRRGSGLMIEYMTIKLASQVMIIGVTDGKICYAGFSDDPSIILKYYPQAVIRSHPEKSDVWQDRLENAWENNDLQGLNFHLEGTEFQLDVWRALLDIPRTKTCGYLDLARKVKRPKSARAVGNAVGANPVSVFIPCHRVVHSGDSRKMGYAWGTDIKQALLRKEGAFI